MNRATRVIISFGLATGLLAACASPTPTPTPTATPVPTPTPTATATPFPLPTPVPLSDHPPLTLPADESPHAYLVEWWYFNAHLTSEEQDRYALHDVVFRVREPTSGIAGHVRHIGLGSATGYVHDELFAVAAPIDTAPGDFELAVGDTLMAGVGGESYTLRAGAEGYAYDLTLRATTEPLLHQGGLVDFDYAGVTYYYTRPRLALSGTLTLPDGSTTSVTGMAWLDKQWGNFQPVAVEWDWASIQLDDGTDLMISSLYERRGPLIERYATLRRPGQPARTLLDDEVSFTPGEPVWRSPVTETAYRTHWNVEVPAEGLSLILRPLEEESEYRSETIGVTYWEAGVDVLDASGEVVGQGFVELNWARGRER